MNLETMQARCARRFRDPLFSVVDATVWADHLNEAVSRFLVELTDLPFAQTITTLSFVAGDRSKPLSQVGTAGVRAVRDATNDVTLTPFHSWPELLAAYPDPATSGAPLAYLVEGQDLYVVPVPSSAVSVEVMAAAEPTAMAAPSDTPTVVPARYHPALVEWALHLAYVDDENVEIAGAHKTTWDEWIARARNELGGGRVDTYPPIEDRWEAAV